MTMTESEATTFLATELAHTLYDVERRNLNLEAFATDVTRALIETAERSSNKRIGSRIKSAFQHLGSDIKSAWDDVVNWLGNFASTITAAFQDLAHFIESLKNGNQSSTSGLTVALEDALELGSGIVMGILDGLILNDIEACAKNSVSNWMIMRSCWSNFISTNRTSAVCLPCLQVISKTDRRG